LMLLISLPAMNTALLERAWPRAGLYALLMGISLSPWGRQQIRPVRELVATVRRPLLVAARGTEVRLFEFVHHAVSVM
ncbi:AmpG family muropeptide MFS transporter, partial [Pseudomonas aeruginosa]